MKKLIFLLLILALSACTDNSTSFVAFDASTNYSPKFYPIINNEASLNKTISISKEIDGRIGGAIILNETFENGVTLNYKLDFAKGSFEGTRNITIILDGDSFTGDYYPHGNFVKPAMLTIKVGHADLSGLVSEDDLKFVYVNENGEIEEMAKKNLMVNFNSNTIALINAELPHFSRYGFTR